MSKPNLAAAVSAAPACLFLSSLATFSCAVAAQTALPPVVVTGTREATPLDRVVADLVVIDAERIRASSADSLEDLLRREGGIQMSRNGGPGQNAGVQIRGANASSTVVLIDGVRAGSATLGQFALETLSLAQIERIEILRGPGSSLYGADAVGGVVQIFTRRGDAAAPRVSAHAAIGTRRSSEADFAASGGSGTLDYALGLSHEGSRGVSAVKPGDRFGLFNPDDDGYRRSSAQFAGGVRLAEGQRLGVRLLTSRLRSHYDGAEFNPPAFAADASPDFRTRATSQVASLDYRAVLSPQWTSSVQLSKQRDDLMAGGTTLSRFDTRRDQLTWQTAWTPQVGHVVVGAFERINESVDTSSYTAPQRGNSAFVLGYSGRFGMHQLQADARHDRNSAYGGVSTGKVGWSISPAPGWTLRAVAGSAFRAPSFNDLYFPGYGVPTVGPERSRSVEIGAGWTGTDAAFRATLYRNRVKGLIGFEPDRKFCPADPSFDFGCARNVDRARLQGATLTASKRLGALDLRAVVDFLDAKDSATGQRLPRRAAHQETLDASWRAGAWTWAATLLAVGARPEAGARLAAYEILDLQTRYRFAPRWQWEAKLLNATDRRYEPALDYQSVGRQLFVGLRYDGVGF